MSTLVDQQVRSTSNYSGPLRGGHHICDSPGSRCPYRHVLGWEIPQWSRSRSNRRCCSFVSVRVISSKATRQNGRITWLFGRLWLREYSGGRVTVRWADWMIEQAGAGWTGLWCFFVKNPSVQWRLCLCLQVVAPAILLLGSPWLPESPRWLISQGRNTEALEILKRLHTGGAAHTDMAAREEFYQISKQIELESSIGNTSLWGLMLKPSYRKRVLCGMFVQYGYLHHIINLGSLLIDILQVPRPVHWRACCGTCILLAICVYVCV